MDCQVRTVFIIYLTMLVSRSDQKATFTDRFMSRSFAAPKFISDMFPPSFIPKFIHSHLAQIKTPNPRFPPVASKYRQDEENYDNSVGSLPHKYFRQNYQDYNKLENMLLYIMAPLVPPRQGQDKEEDHRQEMSPFFGRSLDEKTEISIQNEDLSTLASRIEVTKEQLLEELKNKHAA